MLLFHVESHYKRTEPKALFPLQRLSMYLAMLFSVLAVIGVSFWGGSHDTSEKFLGGLGSADTWEDNPKKIFSWHPVMMVCAFTFCTTQAIFSYRYQWSHHYLGKFGQKFMHLMWHTIAMGLMIFGLFATIKWHRLEDKADLYSLHSWLGVATVTVYSAQYLVGFWHFFFPGSRLETRRAYYPMHVFFGIFSYFCANFTILSGLTEKNYLQKCWYSMSWDTKDYNPAQYYTKIPLGCRISNGVGLLVVFTVMTATYAAMDMRASLVRKTARRSSFLDIE